MTVPQSLLSDFFREAKTALLDLVIDSPRSFGEIRSLLLTIQISCLDRVIDRYNKENHGNSHLVTGPQVQSELRQLKRDKLDRLVREQMDEMNDAARLSFCRLVLFSECLQGGQRGLQAQMQLQASRAIQKSDIMEFCGICIAAVRLSNVRKHLERGMPLFEGMKHIPANRAVAPQQRLEQIQRIFFSSAPNEYTDDKVLIAIFDDMMLKLKAAIANATIAAEEVIFSDHDQGGFTRVVSVSFSEKNMDDHGRVIEEKAPSGQTMEQQTEEQQREQLRFAAQAAALQQEILGELLSMHEDEREMKLAKAKNVSDDFMKRALSIPAGAERVEFLRSIDSQTQRLMAMHKLWEGMLAAHGGKPPVMRHQQARNK
jgi:hypothetical protein